MKHLIFLIGIGMVFLSCRNSSTDLIDPSDLKIKAGYICGWGSGIDTLEITNQTVRYVYYIPRQSMQAQISKTRKLSDQEWVDIRKALNWSQFNSLSYKTCNVCFDGCDEWIAVQNGALSHQITFTRGLKIDTINALQAKLAQLKAEFAP
ncbi:hypothetical protein [Aquirufa rosea]|uniref:Uncharacterized protein n=1 Tax=Aquirufa rosea TaxID=2509241 RepID=A0A4Q1BZI8_9BACT|nr:hypothetical protein [Aquirufa rosea]RXK48972.1 hypothetical protein ESB04_08465 [Aquirufa rosea]